MRRHLCGHMRGHTPWIDFRFDLSRAPIRFLYLLGQAEAKIDWIKGAFLPPAEAVEMKRVHFLRGVAATTAIEGNSLSLEEVSQLMESEGSFHQPPSKQYLEQEVKNVLELYNDIGNHILEGGQTQLSVETILNYNRRLLANLPREENTSAPGTFRSHRVRVAQYPGAPEDDLPFLANRLCEWLSHNTQAMTDSAPMVSGIICALLAHLYIAWIHPFADGNGRTARALEFQLLLTAGMPDVAAHLLSNYYNETRSEYYRRLDLSWRKASALPFMEYALEGFVDSLKQTQEKIAEIQTRIHWEPLCA